MNKQLAKSESARGCQLLKQAQFAQGWRLYASRHFATGNSIASLHLPVWQGEPLAGKSILVVREQAIGDEIWLGTCLPDLLKQGARLILSCEARLSSLYRRSFPHAQILAGTDFRALKDRLPKQDIDFVSHLGDLSIYLRPTRDSFPSGSAYLVADSARRRSWQERLAQLGPGLKVGFSWQGGANLNELRLPSLTLLGPILKAAGVHWIDLQYGDTAEFRRLLQERLGCRMHHFDDLDLMNDMEGLVALVAELDLVVSIPNTTIHVAGALDKQTLLVFDPSWGCCWVTKDQEVPWYPQCEVLTLNQRRDWGELGQRILLRLNTARAGVSQVR